MFNKIKKIFSKDEDKDDIDKETDAKVGMSEIDQAKASITYYVKDDNQIYMDIQLADYERDTLKNFAEIIAGLSSIRFQLQTMEMIKDSLDVLEDGEVFEYLASEIIRATEIETFALEKRSKENNKEEQPWIKPSQMIN